MFSMVNLYSTLAPRATTPKSCDVSLNIARAQSSPCAIDAAHTKKEREMAKRVIRIRFLPYSCLTKKVALAPLINCLYCQTKRIRQTPSSCQVDIIQNGMNQLRCSAGFVM